MRALLRLAIAAAAAAAAALFVHWCVVQPPLAAAHALRAPAFVEFLLGASARGPAPPEWFRHLNLALLAAIGLGSSALALFILFKSQLSASTLRLAAALALAPLSGAYFFFVATHDAYRVALEPGSTAQRLVSVAAYTCAFTALTLLVRFFLEYPRRPSEEELKRYYEKSWAQLLERTRLGWRRHLYPRGSAVMRGRDEPKSKWAGLLQRQVQGDNVKTWRFFWSPWAMAVAVGFALAAAAVDAYVQSVGIAHLTEAARWVRALGWATGAMLFVAAFGAAFQGLQFHHREAFADDRARIDWIYGTVLIGGWLLVAIGPLWWALLILLPEEGRSPAWQSAFMVFTGPMAVGAELFIAAFLASLAVSIFYRGAVDPRLAAQRITLFGLMSLVVAILFVLLERAVVVKLVAWLQLPQESGVVFAAAAVAGTLAPVRSTLERSVNGWVARYLPLETLVQGERKSLAVVFCDISGYTALSAQDEKQAMLLAALLQRQAAQVASEGGGRVVKSMGDAVILAFDVAARAARAIDVLHARFLDAAGTLGLAALPLHSGAHYGELTQTRDGDLYGQTINIAARLQSLAGKGQRVVSAEFAAAAGLAGASMRDLGPQRLKNVPEPVACHELLEAATA